MAGASDKARFFLEKSVPELRDLERKGIFSKDELSSIVKKRSGFEHTLNARGSQVSDYVCYAEYEMNLEALRRKRIKRLRVRSRGYDGQRRIFSILNRATEKFHGDIGLWILYVDYARKQKSYKKVAEVMTKMLRMHPNEAKLWIYAAKYAVEDKGDMMEARGLLQRGLRFCEKDQDLWLQYGKLEMMFIAKIAGRKQILGLDEPEAMVDEGLNAQPEVTDDIMPLPSILAGEYKDPEETHVPAKFSDSFKDDRILSGALPAAVFDAAMKQFENDPRFAVQFFDMIADFDGSPSQQTLLNHIMDSLRSQKHKTPATTIRYIKQPVIGIVASDPAFPSAFGITLSRMRDISAEDFDSRAQAGLYLEVLEWLVRYLRDSNLDHDLRQVLVITIPRIFRQYQTVSDGQPAEHGARLAALRTILDEVGLKDLAQSP